MSLPKPFSLRVVHGIVGGFVAPKTKAVKSVAYTPETNLLQISSTSLPSSALGPITVQKDGYDDELLRELQFILMTLPTEQPPGSEDIYGMDTSIMWGSDDFQWVNACTEGSGEPSTVQVTDEQKEKFKRALAIADELVAKGNPS